jgi:two-component system, chemotaxis family, CheB/CheR fusion protein
MNLKSPTGSAGRTPGQKSLKFPVVGIGTSAGGLEALEQFFSNMPEDAGMAFVVIQHLDPNYKGMMPELIRKVTKMKVIQASDRLKVEKDTVYVLPPNKNMSILNGRLHLFAFVDTHGLRLPINFFFHSLADDLGENSIGIVLSGMGSDGTLGLQSIKKRGGITMVQEPSTAGYDSMPKNAINSVKIDVVAPAAELPRKLVSIFNRALYKNDTKNEFKDKSSIEKIILLIRSKTGHDFSQYKKSTIYRRVERRMMVHKINSIAAYIRFLMENPDETGILYQEMLIGTTSFFRDHDLWQFLINDIFPALVKSRPDKYTLRLWVPGCSTGEEAYSYAIALKEVIESFLPDKNISAQIFASDLDSRAIDKARKGIYSEGISACLSGEQIDRFFSKTGTFLRINPDIREMVVFALQNVINDPPFTKIDLISCRNLLIYHEPELQKKLLTLFHYSLNPDGLLVLGTSETLGSQSHLFVTVNTRYRVFRKSSFEKTDITDFPTSLNEHKYYSHETRIPVKSIDNIQTLTDTLILQNYSPAGVLVNSEGDIIYLTRRSGKYLELAAGKANMNIFSMLREGFEPEFRIAFRKAARSYEKVNLRNIKTESGSDSQLTDVIIQQIEKPVGLKGLILIVFRDVIPFNDVSISGHGKKANVRTREMEIEQQRLKDELQSTVEAMQVSEEELKSVNEELQSTNEELQSTNEELTSSKEELQSMNEELQTVNLELMNKVDEFTIMSNDMRNLLESTEIATLFLTKDLKVRRFTSGVSKIFNLIEQDIGRPLSDLSSELLYDDFTKDMKEVLRTLAFIEKQIVSNSGTWFSVRIMPYRTTEDKIDGLVLTFSDITTTKRMEAELKKTISDLNTRDQT